MSFKFVIDSPFEFYNISTDAVLLQNKELHLCGPELFIPLNKKDSEKISSTFPISFNKPHECIVNHNTNEFVMCYSQKDEIIGILNIYKLQRLRGKKKNFILKNYFEHTSLDKNDCTEIIQIKGNLNWLRSYLKTKDYLNLFISNIERCHCFRVSFKNPYII